MTDITFDLIARDKASRIFKNVSHAADGTSSSMGKFLKVGTAAAAGMGLLTAAAGAFVIKAGAGYVNSLNQIQALTGANAKTMTAAAKTLESNSGLYAKMGQTTGDAAAGVVELTKAGLSLHDSLKAVNATMVLAKAGELSVADASSLVANSLNTFGLKAKDTGKLANQLANAANISSADVSDLAESFKYVSPVAAAAGVSMGQTSAILAELSNSGIKASSAGTALRTFLLNLQAPAAAGAKVLKDLNIQVFDAAGNMKPLPQVIDMLAGALNGLPAKQKAADLKAIFGKVGIAGAMTILKQGKTGLEEYTKGVNKAGAASKLAEAKSQGLAGSFGMLKSSAVSGAQSIYRQFSPIADRVIRPLAQRFADFTTNLGPKMAAAFGKIRDTVGRVLGKINIAGIGKKLATQARSWAAPVIAGFKQGLDSGDWSGLGKSLGNGIVKAAGALGDLTAKFDKVFAKIDWVGIGITLGKQAPSLLIGLAAGILNFDLMGLLKGVAKHWQDVLLAIVALAFTPGKIVGKVGEVLARIPFVGKLLEWGLLSLKKFSDGLVRGVGRALGFLGKAFIEGFRRVFPKAGAKFAEELALFPLRVQLMGLKLAQKGLEMLRRLGAAIAHGTGSVVAKLGELIAKMLRPFADAGSWLIQKGVALLGGLARGILSKVSDVLAPVKALGGKIKGALSGAATWLVGAGRAVVQGLINGIESMAGSLLSKARSIASSVTGAFKGMFKIHSPSRVFRDIGRNLMDGLLRGIADRKMTVQDAITKVGDAIQKAGDRIKNLMSTRAGFKGTFGADSLFGVDLSHTTTDAAGNDTTTPETIADLIQYQKDQATHAQTLLADVKKVTKLGLSKSLVAQLQSQGTSGAAALHALASGSSAQIAQLNALNKQTSDSLQSAGMRAGNYVRGGSIDADIKRAQKQDHVLELLEHHLKVLADHEKKGETIVVEIDSEAVITAIHRRNKRKGVKTAGV